MAHLLILVDVDTLELAEPDEVGSHQDAELLPLTLPLLPVPGVALVLHAHPQLVHLREVEGDEVHRVRYRASFIVTLTVQHNKLL